MTLFEAGATLHREVCYLDSVVHVIGNILIRDRFTFDFLSLSSSFLALLQPINTSAPGV
jgi:hypothetical protein